LLLLISGPEKLYASDKHVDITRMGGRISFVVAVRGLDYEPRAFMVRRHQGWGISMKWISLAGTLLSACLAVVPAKASELLDIMNGTLNAAAEPQVMEDGRTGGCSYTFVAITRDHVYRSGQYLRVTGSLDLLKTRFFVKTPGVASLWSIALTLIVDEAWMGEDGEIHFTPSAPSQAYLIGAGTESHPDKRSEPYGTRVPGSASMLLETDPALKILMEATSSSHAISVAFNQFYGDRLITVPIELDVTDVKSNGERVRSKDTAIDFQLCLADLSNDFPVPLKAK